MVSRFKMFNRIKALTTLLLAGIFSIQLLFTASSWTEIRVCFDPQNSFGLEAKDDCCVKGVKFGPATGLTPSNSNSECTCCLEASLGGHDLSHFMPSGTQSVCPFFLSVRPYDSPSFSTLNTVILQKRSLSAAFQLTTLQSVVLRV